MTGVLFPGGPETLPETIPVFPLTGALLLPHGRMPLNIFEPRYINMVTDALGAHRLIGMVQPKGMDEESPEGDAEVYSVGCLGRISEFSETEGEKFSITLSGMNRFRITGEAGGAGGYRRMDVSYAGFEDDMDEDGGLNIERDKLLDALKKYLNGREIGADWSAIQDASDLTLVISLSMACPFDPREKQALLECAASKERAELLAALLTMAAHSPDERPGAGH